MERYWLYVGPVWKVPGRMNELALHEIMKALPECDAIRLLKDIARSRTDMPAPPDAND